MKKSPQWVLIAILLIALCMGSSILIDYFVVGKPENPRSVADVEESVGRSIAIDMHKDDVSKLFKNKNILYNYFVQKTNFLPSILQEIVHDKENIAGYFDGFIPDTSRTLTTRGSIHIYVVIDTRQTVVAYLIREEFMGL